MEVYDDSLCGLVCCQLRGHEGPVNLSCRPHGLGLVPPQDERDGRVVGAPVFDDDADIVGRFVAANVVVSDSGEGSVSRPAVTT